MKHARKLIALFILAGLLGCSSDPNKNLKPVDPSAKPPQPAKEQQDGAGGKGGGAPPVIK